MDLTIIKGGIFHWFPFIHVVAVKKELHRNGIGKQLMTFIEDLGFKQSDSSNAPIIKTQPIIPSFFIVFASLFVSCYVFDGRR